MLTYKIYIYNLCFSFCSVLLLLLCARARACLYCPMFACVNSVCVFLCVSVCFSMFFYFALCVLVLSLPYVSISLCLCALPACPAVRASVRQGREQQEHPGGREDDGGRGVLHAGRQTPPPPHPRHGRRGAHAGALHG